MIQTLFSDIPAHARRAQGQRARVKERVHRRKYRGHGNHLIVPANGRGRGNIYCQSVLPYRIRANLQSGQADRRGQCHKNAVHCLNRISNEYCLHNYIRFLQDNQGTDRFHSLQYILQMYLNTARLCRRRLRPQYTARTKSDLFQQFHKK